MKKSISLTGTGIVSFTPSLIGIYHGLAFLRWCCYDTDGALLFRAHEDKTPGWLYVVLAFARFGHIMMMLIPKSEKLSIFEGGSFKIVGAFGRNSASFPGIWALTLFNSPKSNASQIDKRVALALCIVIV